MADQNQGRVQVLAADSNDQSSLQKLASEISKSTNTLDIVIYNAGVLKGVGNVLQVGLDGLKENINTNLYGAHHIAVEFSPFLLRSKTARNR